MIWPFKRRPTESERRTAVTPPPGTQWIVRKSLSSIDGTPGISLELWPADTDRERISPLGALRGPRSGERMFALETGIFAANRPQDILKVSQQIVQRYLAQVDGDALAEVTRLQAQIMIDQSAPRGLEGD